MTRLPFLPAAFALLFRAPDPRSHRRAAPNTWRPVRQPRAPGWGATRRRIHHR